MGLDNPIDQGQSQPGPSPEFFRGKEGLEDPLDRGVGHPHPLVGNADFDVLQRGVGSLPGGEHGAIDKERPYGQLSTGDTAVPRFHHGVPCIDAEIEERLVELCVVHQDNRDPIPQIENDFDGPGECLLYHPRKIEDRLVDIDCFRMHLGFAGKRQYLPYKTRPALYRAVDGVDALLERAVFISADFQEGHVSKYDPKDVVEIVGDSPCERPERFHRLQFANMELHLLPLGDVFLHGEVMGDDAVRVLDRGDLRRLPVQVAVLFPVVEFSFPIPS